MWPSRERFKKVQPFFFFLTTWFVSTPFPFKTHPSQLAALSIIYFGCLLENKWSCSCRWVCQTCVYFPVSGPLLFWLKSDPLKWIPGHQKMNFKKKKKNKKLQERGQKRNKTKQKKTTNFSWSNFFLCSFVSLSRNFLSYITKQQPTLEDNQYKTHIRIHTTKHP